MKIISKWIKVEHEPVLLNEVIEKLHINRGVRYANERRYIDATLGAGGYTKAICEMGGQVLGIDADASMLTIAKSNLEGKNVVLVHGNFRDISKIASEHNFTNVDGIVFDLGVSNIHFMNEQRGFSFKNPDADLDMRLDPKSQSLKASDLLNVLREDQLQEMLGKSVARKVVERRKTKRFEKVGDLLALFGKKTRRIHPATVAFLQLRIAVNSELENLKEALPQAYSLLRPGGVLLVVSFHSLEDEIVKDYMKSKEFIRPSSEEVRKNPKSRSAILRYKFKK